MRVTITQASASGPERGFLVNVAIDHSDLHRPDLIDHLWMAGVLEDLSINEETAGQTHHFSVYLELGRWPDNFSDITEPYKAVIAEVNSRLAEADRVTKLLRHFKTDGTDTPE